MKIPLHKPLWGPRAEQAVLRVLRTGTGTADGPQSALLREKLSALTGVPFAIPVTSCTHAMETAVAALGAKTGDEVIVPSFTLSATATAVMIRGARPVFADIDPFTYSLDPLDVERLITKRTVGIVTVHYAGLAGPSFDALRRLAKAHSLWLVEDAAHCIGASYKKKALGTFGDAGALSFHGTKNVAAGEGGAILTKNRRLSDAMEIFRSIGTDRMAFLAGKVSAYRWVGEGSSYMLSDIQAALINVQLDQIKRINKDRHHIATIYNNEIHTSSKGINILHPSPQMTQTNWHIYTLQFPKARQAKRFFGLMHEQGIGVMSHYVPLHSSPMGKRLGHTRRLPVTESVAETLVRMPIYAGMSDRELSYIVSKTNAALSIL